MTGSGTYPQEKYWNQIRPDKSESLIVKKVQDIGIKIHWKHTVVNTKGYKRINSIELMKLNEKGTGVIGDKINVDLSLGTKSLYLFVLKGIFKFESWNNIHSLEFLKK